MNKPLAARTRSAFLALALGAFVITGCDIFDLDSTRVIVGTVMRSPSIALAEQGEVQTEITTASVFFGQREPGFDVLLSNPVGVIGADVNLAIHAIGDLRDVPLTDLQDGTYFETSGSNAELEYRSGASYRLEIDELGEIYEVDVSQAPAPEAPQGVEETHQVDESMFVSRNQFQMAFLEVLRLDGGPAQTWTNRPADTLALMNALADPSPYQALSFEIPGEAFPEPGDYAVVLYTLVPGIPVPDPNLHSVSSVLVGGGEARLVRVD